MQTKFAILVSNSARSICYLKYLKKNNLKPKNIVHLDDLSNNYFAKFLKKKIFYFKSTHIKKFNTKTINKEVSSYLLKIGSKIIIYSGYPGIIIKKKKLLKAKNIVHAHPGKLPEYKGSTTIYYSLLKEKKIYCSTIVLNEKIDSGKIVMIKKYMVPKNLKLIDKEYDNEIRANNIVLFIKKLKKTNVKKNISSTAYHVIHPVLRSIVLNKKKYKIRK
ncbi:formyltransferase family protein [Candidatus Pelagibacter sp. Uisw_130]|uniref:formyltransferase family protein n=1 Tax=Candidatus Pelagibacter sp. Uisw_130 TaxID=3230989 RepID=UPI0039EBDC47